MNPAYIPSPDTIPVAWGWFQALLLLTLPLHLLTMNAMLGGLGIAIVSQLSGRPVGIRLAHRIAVVLPLVIAFVVNLGVAPLLFLQVLYGQFIYASSILMGISWILIVPILIIAYYGAYLYDFRFSRLGPAGPWLALVVFVLLLAVGFFLSNNMLLMALPGRFGDYFGHRAGTMLATADPTFFPRYLHMMTGALAVGGLFVALLGRYRRGADPELADYAQAVGMKTFGMLTLANVCLGVWFLLSQPRETMLLFMGGDGGATVVFTVALLLIGVVLVAAFRQRLWPALGGVVVLVYLMSFMRAWLRADYLSAFFDLGQLRVVADYSPLVLFLVTLAGAVLCIAWMLKRAVGASGTEGPEAGEG